MYRLSQDNECYTLFLMIGHEELRLTDCDVSARGSNQLAPCLHTFRRQFSMNLICRFDWVFTDLSLAFFGSKPSRRVSAYSRRPARLLLKGAIEVK